jgi:hypothetical protein
MVEAVVAVPEDVADAGDVRPRDPGLLGFEIGRNAARRFGDDLDPAASVAKRSQPWPR